MNINIESDGSGSIIISRAFLFLVFFLGFVLYPTSLMPGGIRSGIALFSIFSLVAVFLSKEVRVGLSSFAFLLCSTSIFLSIVFSANTIVFNELMEVARPFFYFSIVLLCRHSCRSLNLDLFAKFLMFFILVEFAFVVLQRLNFDFFVQIIGSIWNIEGNWKYRNTGTFSNPNILGGFLIFTWVGYVFFNRGRRITELFLTVVVLFSIILSGSKTSIVLFVAAVYFVYFLKYGFVRYAAVSILVIPFILLSAYLWLVNNAEDNLYIVQILKIMEPGGLENIKSYTDRQNIWSSVINNYDGGGLFRALVGYGPDKMGFLRVVDNEYIGVYYRYGLIGAITLYAPVLLFLAKVYIGRKLKKEIQAIYHAILVLLVLLFVAGFVMESFSSWVYPFIFYVYIGMGLAKLDSYRKAEIRS